MTTNERAGTPGACRALTAGVLLTAVAGLSGCASGFVGGGMATAAAGDGRIAVESRTASATIGPAGPAAGTASSSATICIDPDTDATFAC